MSKDNGTMKQHIVPRAHLRRFVDKNGFLYVHRLNDIDNIKCFKQKPDKVSCENNYYDDDPYGDFSIEKYLKREEDKGQPIIDGIIDSKLKESDCAPLIRYLSMIVNRSRVIRDIRDDVESGKTWMKPDNVYLTDNDPIFMQMYGLLWSTDELAGSSLSEYNCVLFKSDGQGQKFVTGDVPFSFIHLHLEEQKLKNELFVKNSVDISSYPGDPELGIKTQYIRQYLIDSMKGAIIVCTLSPDVCLIAYREPYDEFINDIKNTLGPHPISYINNMIISSCTREVYADRCFKKEVMNVKQRLL